VFNMSSVADSLKSTLPPSDSTKLFLTRPTKNEALHIVKVNSQPWKGPLSLEAYIRREAVVGAVLHSARDSSKPEKLSKDLSAWMLTTTDEPPDARPILASCETFRKRALVAFESGDPSRGRVVKEVLCYGVASVFGEHQFRRRGYARRMMIELAEKMKTGQADEDSPCMFSVLFSDIGKVSIPEYC
jgi:hypothetical protein